VTGPTPAIVGSEPVRENCGSVVVMEGASVMVRLLAAAVADEEPGLVAAAEPEFGRLDADWVFWDG